MLILKRRVTGATFNVPPTAPRARKKTGETPTETTCAQSSRILTHAPRPTGPRVRDDARFDPVVMKAPDSIEPTCEDAKVSHRPSAHRYEIYGDWPANRDSLPYPDPGDLETANHSFPGRSHEGAVLEAGASPTLILRVCKQGTP